jgi:uncharacterized protein (TIGR04255 family)
MSTPGTAESLQGAGNLYRNAPLAEAVCEFRFLPGEPWDITFFGLLYEKVKPEYEIREKVTQIQSGGSPGPAGTFSMVFGSQETLRVSRPDRSSFIQVSPNILSVHHVPPYPGWAGFVRLIRFAFDAYIETAKPKAFERIGLRCINHIRIPGASVELADYFDFYPFVGPNLPKDHFDIICGMSTSFDEAQSILRIILRTIPSADESSVLPFMLDLDYFVQTPGRVGLADVTKWLEVAHTRMKGGFEGAIKDRLRAIFNAECNT